MSKEGYEKTREEILKERAEVLSRAGRNLSDVLDRLKTLDLSINRKIDSVHITAQSESGCHGKDIYHEIIEINEEITLYNTTREQARLKYYYLIVTREAMGLRRHQWIEEIYRIPPRKKALTGFDG
ncbi:MAG: hypothetical protein PHU03_02545 [Syntrophales bacterium]|nr:hypothetical protein [Syntrophales bacterium]